MDEMLLFLQWILFAMRPLKVEEFYFAMMSSIGTSISVPSKRYPAVVSQEDMSRYVLTLSKGLAEVTRRCAKKPKGPIHSRVSA